MNLKKASSLAGSILLLLLMATISLPLAAAPFAYVTNTGAGTVSVIDTATNLVVGSPIVVGTQPYGIAVTPDGSHVYVANEGFGSNLGSISVIDTSNNTVTTPISYTGGKISVPVGVAITPDGTSVYVTNFGSSSVAVIATATNTVTTTIPVGGGPDRVAITPDGTKAYVSNQYDGTVSVIDTATNAVVGSPIKVGSSPAGIAITPDGTHVYVVNDGTYPTYAGTVSVIATATNTVTAGPISVGTEPLDAAVTPDGTSVYVTNFDPSGEGTVSVIATATNTVSDTITIGNFFAPFGIGITGDGTKAYVVDEGDFAVSVINTATNTVTGSPITVGVVPFEIAIQKPATPAQQVANLITVVQGMNITGLGSSLTDQLQVVENDLTTNNGLACGDLKAFANHVNAQTGKKITTAQANTLLTDVASIEAALSCGG